MTQLLSAGLATDTDWDRMVASAPSATFYHTRTWAEVCKRALPNCTPEARIYRFADGVEALLPGAVQTAARGAVRAFKSVYPCDFGGLLASARLTAEHTAAVADDLRHAGFASVQVYESPFAVLPAMPGFTFTTDFTQAIVVDDGLDGVLRRMKYQERQSLRRSARCGVVVEEHSNEHGVDEFYRLYLLSAERWGEATTWLRPVELLRAAVELGDGSVRIYLAMFEDEVIGGQVDYLHGTVGAISWRAFDYEKRSAHPNVALQIAGATEAIKTGVRLYDMGPSSGLVGLEELKERYGAVRLGFRVWTWEHPTHKAYRIGRKGFDRAQDAVHSLTRR